MEVKMSLIHQNELFGKYYIPLRNLPSMVEAGILKSPKKYWYEILDADKLDLYSSDKPIRVINNIWIKKVGLYFMAIEPEGYQVEFSELTQAIIYCKNNKTFATKTTTVGDAIELRLDKQDLQKLIDSTVPNTYLNVLFQIALDRLL